MLLCLTLLGKEFRTIIIMILKINRFGCAIPSLDGVDLSSIYHFMSPTFYIPQDGKVSDNDNRRMAIFETVFFPV